MAIWRNLSWAIFGAVLGNLSAGPTNRVADQLSAIICPGDDLLAEGLALRRSAIEHHLPGKHNEANAKFERSAACGNSEALAHLGLAYCHGWGRALDQRQGRGMIRTAFARGARLTPEWFSDPDVCPPKP